LVMCNIAQIVNVLHSMLLTDGERCIRTPAYYAFELLKPHRGQTGILVEADNSSPLGLSVSASRQDKRLVLTCVNPKHDSGMKVTCWLSGAKPASGSARILHHQDLNACNTFEDPGRVVPRDWTVNIAGTVAELDLPPMSIVTAVLRLE
jgi:alpha-N-arabinofuranosidase